VAKLVNFVALKMIKRYSKLILIELVSELKSGNIILTAGIQASAFVLILFYGLVNPIGEDWVAFFWLITLFAAVSGLNRSFIQANKGLSLYLFQLYSAKDYFIIRWVLNVVFIVTVNLLTYFLLLLFYGFSPVSALPFMVLLILGSVGFAAIFTFTGSIASLSKNALVLLPILSIPLIIPLIMILFKASGILLEPGAGMSDIIIELALVLVLNTLYTLPGLLLFNNLWGE
jgi:heme exporter protein B